MRARAAAIATLLLAACAAPPPQVTRLGAADMQAFLADTTVRVSQAPLGTQIEHLAPDGTVTLVFPGIQDLTTGTWALKGPDTAPEVCFDYEALPVPTPQGASQATGFCFDAALYLEELTEIVDGDPLALAGRTQLPVSFERGAIVSLAEAQRALGQTTPIGPNKLPLGPR